MSELNNFISPIEQYLLCGMLAVLLYQMWFYLRYMLVRRKRLVVLPRQRRKDRNEANEELPGVSVIVAARNEAHNLRPYLHQLLDQDYPRYEVIVVNDGSEDDTQQVIEEYAARYPQLKITFVPCQARVPSSKKLALTLGVKAAQYEYLVLTDADCCPASRQWLRTLTESYRLSGKTEVVLGFGAYFKEKGALNRLIQYETLFTGLQYLGMAAAHRPYMGVGRNLSYRKSLFLKNDGFAHLPVARAGDDDLPVNRFATGRNTAVVRSPESVTWSVPETSGKAWYQQRRRHLSVSHLYRTGSKARLCIEPLSRAAWYILLIAIFSTGGMIAAAAAAGLYLLRLMMQLVVMSVSARRMGVPAAGAETVFWDIAYPLLTLWILIQPKSKHVYW